jgi:hypothetical protein
VDAQRLLAQGGRQCRDDQRQRGRGLHFGQLLDQAPQAPELAAGGRVDLDAELEGDHVVRVDLPRRDRRHDLPLAHDVDAVGEVEDLLQLVGHEQDGGARGPQAADQAEDGGGLRPPEGGGRLVEDQQPRVARQRPGHGDGLALPARQRGHRAGQVGDGDVEPGQHPPGLGVHLGPGQEQLVPFPAEEQVGDRVEVVA